MSECSLDELKNKRCTPCEGGVPKLSEEQAEQFLKNVPEWEILVGGNRIQRKWTTKNFLAGMAFLEEVARLAEDEGHHPDVHLTDYKNVTVELTTHAIGGLSENDFILAAKIDDLPIELAKKK